MIVGALYRAFAAGAEVPTVHLAEEVAHTGSAGPHPREEIDALRAWSRGRSVPASADLQP